MPNKTSVLLGESDTTLWGTRGIVTFLPNPSTTDIGNPSDPNASAGLERIPTKPEDPTINKNNITESKVTGRMFMVGPSIPTSIFQTPIYG
jgi:hypothetical protein